MDPTSCRAHLRLGTRLLERVSREEYLRWSSRDEGIVKRNTQCLAVLCCGLHILLALADFRDFLPFHACSKQHLLFAFSFRQGETVGTYLVFLLCCPVRCGSNIPRVDDWSYKIGQWSFYCRIDNTGCQTQRNG